MTQREGRTASHWGSYIVSTEDDEVVDVRPVAADREPSAIGQNYRGTLRHDSRILRPAVRRGWLESRSPRGRGSDDYVEVSWEEAVELIASEIDRVRTTHGNEAIYGGSYGWGSAGRFHHAQSQVHRFLNTTGGYTRSVNTYSHAADEVILPHMVGDRDWFLRSVPSWAEIAEHTQELVAFGGLPARSAQVNPGGVGAHLNAAGQRAAADAGIRYTIVTPVRSDSLTELRADWMPVRPNTDVALMLGLAHTILVRGLADLDFLDRCCVGFDRFEAELRGEIDGIEKTAAWAAEITGIAVDQITGLAERIATRRSLITVTWSLQRQHHGEMAYWAAMSLAAMAGSMGLPGGGFGTGYSSMHNAHIWDRVSPAAALPQGANPVSSFIPVARIADLLLHPGERFDYNGQQHTYPEIRLVYWIGGNPFHHHQDLNRLLRAWARPETIVVHEPFWNALAKHADIIMPVATSLERDDFAIGMADNWLSRMEKVADPPPGVTTDYEVFAAIAERLGCGDAFTEGRNAAEWVRELWDRSIPKAAVLGFDLPSFEEFTRLGGVELPMHRSPITAFSELRHDPTAHPLKTPSGRLEIYSETIAGFGYEDCPGWARWIEPAEWLGSDLATRFPLHLVSPQPDGKLHSQLDHGQESRRHKHNGRAVLRIGPVDARERELSEGDVVRVWNARGACLAAVKIDDGMLARVVALPTGAWYDPVEPGVPGSLDKHGNPNVLTLDIGTSRLAQGPSAHTCLVEVERYLDTVPTITAHQPPRFVRREALTQGHQKRKPMNTNIRHDITQNFIDGRWVSPTTTDIADVRDSNTDEVIGSAPLSSAADVNAAVAAALRAQPLWGALTPAVRAGHLRAVARELEARHEILAQLIAQEVGANQAISRGSQTMTPVMSFNIAADLVENYEFTKVLGSNRIVREPIGVVGAITAWNFPLHLVTVKAAFAIAAGNTVVVKPSEIAPLTAGVLAEALVAARLPAGVINIVFGNGPVVGEAIVAHPDVRMISFTGSTRAGRRIGEIAAQKVAKVALELGGKSPLVILPDAPLEEAVRFGVGDLLLNNGQRCDGLTRMVVPRELLAEVETIAAQVMAETKVGPSSEETSELGPMASRDQQQRVRGYIEKGIAEGAKLVTGGPETPELPEPNRNGYFIRPTVFSEVTSDMTIAHEEIFGPVLSIQTYTDTEDAIRIANDTEYGLHAAVYGGNEAEATKVAGRIEAGMVTVNGGSTDMLAPFGGYKQSGIGREFGIYGFEEFLEVKAVRLPGTGE